ncbi:transcriptional regulator [Arachidicoccus ginsenosidimutans]|uniref:GbsR/MarR family transcriptional regulator n=1 Tax=Arachidicoccus sp. BS20 TaxID=1850526 RepID=UPI0007F12022|nr:transcriptional regulator [Arachidicoccus sp. BS20]ANI88373.1 transcriptional regulator [Arachidicoccus sp. BS20]
MNIQESQKKFIETWGHLGSQWGINKSVAQIHALLLISPEPITTEQIMQELVISRGNANMGLRQLIDYWGIVYKKSVAGDRKEYFVAEKDIWKWSHKIGSVRKKRELDPVLEVLSELKQVKNTDKTAEGKEFVTQIANIEQFTSQIGSLADKLFNSQKGEFLMKLLKLFL